MISSGSSSTETVHVQAAQPALHPTEIMIGFRLKPSAPLSESLDLRVSIRSLSEVLLIIQRCLELACAFFKIASQQLKFSIIELRR